MGNVISHVNNATIQCLATPPKRRLMFIFCRVPTLTNRQRNGFALEGALACEITTMITNQNTRITYHIRPDIGSMRGNSIHRNRVAWSAVRRVPAPKVQCMSEIRPMRRSCVAASDYVLGIVYTLTKTLASQVPGCPGCRIEVHVDVCSLQLSHLGA